MHGDVGGVFKKIMRIFGRGGGNAALLGWNACVDYMSA